MDNEKQRSNRLQKLKEVFDKHDIDNSATVDVNELEKIFNELGVKKNANEIAKLFDREKDSLKRVEHKDSLTFEEFEKLFDINRLLTVFNSIDEDSSGSINVSELQMAMKKMGYNMSRKTCEQLMQKVDTNQWRITMYVTRADISCRSVV